MISLENVKENTKNWITTQHTLGVDATKCTKIVHNFSISDRQAQREKKIVDRKIFVGCGAPSALAKNL